MPAQALAAAAVLVSFVASGNRVNFKLDHETAALTWYSPATFRFQRTMDSVGRRPKAAAGNELPETNSPPKQKVDFTVEGSANVVRIRSKTLEVTIQKRGLLVAVNRAGGERIMEDLTAPVFTPAGAVAWERAMPPGVQYYAWNPVGGSCTFGTFSPQNCDLVTGKPGMEMGLRGRAGAVVRSVLISSAGYGEYHQHYGVSEQLDLSRPDRYPFDFSQPDRYRVAAPRVDYFFYYGPAPKKIFEELHAAQYSYPCPDTTDHIRIRVQFSAAPAGVEAGWSSLKDDLLAGTNHSLLGCPAISFDLGKYEALPAGELQRARQVGSLAQTVIRRTATPSDFRNQLESLFHSYSYETSEHGLPLWRPLPFQFPDDAESARHADEFMLGDELLIAPIYTASDRRSIYLPPGIWTNLATNEELQGRRTIEVETNGLPVFARNGTIVPLDSASGMALHYFPKLGGEFFILEKDVNAWTQIHAAPAGDVMRLEIESKVARDCEWVVHHVERPSGVGFEDRKYVEAASREAMAAQGWFYDAGLKNLHVRAHVEAGEDRVIHVGW